MHTVALASSEHPLVATSSTRSIWIGRGLSALVMLFLTVDAAMKLFMTAAAANASAELGFTEGAVFAIGLIEAVCVIFYLVPRTAILGTLLWVGYFGGAIATHLRAGSPLLTHTLSPLVFAALLAFGLWLRDGRLRRMMHTAFDGS